jgi:hypothetical protein
MKRILPMALGLLIAIALNAQTPTGTIQGNVQDPSQAAVPGARVEIVNSASGEAKHLVTDTGGRFVQPFLLPGLYNVTIDATGFRRAQQQAIQLDVGQNRSVDFHLDVGNTKTEIQVVATTPAIDTNTSTLGQTIENQQVADLPLNGRSVFDLAGLSVAVYNVGSNNSTPHMGGARASTSDTMIDGVSVIVPENNPGNTLAAYEPPIDSIQEFTVATNSLAAEYGRTAGGVMNAATKQGTNRIHFTAFDFLRNSDLNANSFWANRSGQGIAKDSNNRFGGTVGGPVWIPHVYKGMNKTFFFTSYERYIDHQNAQNWKSVAPDSWRTGAFPASIPIYDPRTAYQGANGIWSRLPFANNTIPTTQLDPAALGMLKYIPSPNQAPLPGTLFSNNLFVASPQGTDEHKLDVRIDHNFTDKWRLFGRASENLTHPIPGNDYGTIAATNTAWDTYTNYNTSIDNTITLSPSLIVDVRLGFSRTADARSPSYAVDISKLGFNSTYQEAAAQTGAGFSLIPRWAGATCPTWACTPTRACSRAARRVTSRAASPRSSRATLSRRAANTAGCCWTSRSNPIPVASSCRMVHIRNRRSTRAAAATSSPIT